LVEWRRVRIGSRHHRGPNRHEPRSGAAASCGGHSCPWRNGHHLHATEQV